MKVTLLCTDQHHPVNAWLEHWQSVYAKEHEVGTCRHKQDVPGGDILFLIACSQVIEADIRAKYRHTLVLHASDLPKGRGWSPHIWALLEGENCLTVSLLEAADDVDTGRIWAKRSFAVPDHALYDEIHNLLFETELALMDEALMLITSNKLPSPQREDISATYYRKRTPADSKLDPALPLKDLFNSIRLADPNRYPAFFELHGHTYTIELKKVKKDGNNHH